MEQTSCFLPKGRFLFRSDAANRAGVKSHPLGTHRRSRLTQLPPLFPAAPAHFKALSFIAACLQTGASKYPLLSGHLYHNIAFDGIVLFQISEAVKYQTALVACIDFLHVILKPL